MLFDCGKSRINICEFDALALNELPLFVQAVCNLQISRNFTLVYGVALEYVVFQDLIGPAAELSTS